MKKLFIGIGATLALFGAIYAIAHKLRAKTDGLAEEDDFLPDDVFEEDDI